MKFMWKVHGVMPLLWLCLSVVLVIRANDKTTPNEKHGIKRCLEEAFPQQEQAQALPNIMPHLANIFVHAAYIGNLSEVNRWLGSAPGLINVFDTLENTALIAAAEEGHLHVINRLLNQPGIQVQLQNDEGYTALMAAVAENDLDIVKRLLQVNPEAQINLKNKLGWTALMLAVNHNFISVTKKLLKVTGIDLNLKCHNSENQSEGFTALMMAVRKGLPALVLELLLAGADRTLKNDAGETALDIARKPNLIENPITAETIIQILTAPLANSWRK